MNIRSEAFAEARSIGGTRAADPLAGVGVPPEIAVNRLRSVEK